MTGRRLHLLLPSWRPQGGVVKILDYALHALAAGHDVVLHCPDPFDASLPLWRIERFGPLRPGERVTITTQMPFGLQGDDLVLISWPRHYEFAAAALAPGMGPERIVHLVQNVRHANPRWIDGYACRLLGRPMTRIMTNDIVLEACRPWLNPDSSTTTIDLGHQTGYFASPRRELGRPVRVASTSWKSNLGGRLEQALAGDAFDFRSVDGWVPWDALRDLYAWADVFLCLPNIEEGFYMPGLEAMEAGCVVITPDVGGNRAWADFGVNCLQVDFESMDSYVTALRCAADLTPEELAAMRAAGDQTLQRFTLAGEASGFAALLGQVWDLVERREPVLR